MKRAMAPEAEQAYMRVRTWQKHMGPQRLKLVVLIPRAQRQRVHARGIRKLHVGKVPRQQLLLRRSGGVCMHATS